MTKVIVSFYNIHILSKYLGGFMKIFRSYILIIALFFVSINSYAQNTEQRVFGCSQGFFVVINNKAQFYEYKGNTWVYDSKKDFTLPNGYKSVYGYEDAICVIVNDKAQLYEFVGNSWVVDSILHEFTLPSGYGSVFGSKRNIGGICVIIDNKVQFYSFWNTWRTNSNSDFILPSGYRSVFGGVDGIGVAVGDKAQFFEFQGASGWAVDSRYDLTLPNGYKSVFGYKGAQIWESVFVVIDDKVQLYVFDRNNNKWDTYSDWVFVIPKN